MPKKKPIHGGARANAGRPAQDKTGPMVSHTIRVPVDVKSFLASVKSSQLITEYVRSLPAFKQGKKTL